MSAAHTPSLAFRVLRRFVDVRESELGLLLGSAGAFFCVLASLFVLRPVREEIGLSRGAQNLPLLWTGTLGVTLLFAPLFAWLVTRYPPRTFLPLTYRILAANLAVFALLSQLLHGEPLVWMRFAFYFWYSASNLLVVSVFWALMADVFRSEQSGRLFGFVGVGGTLGALVGARIAASTVHELETLGLVACAIVLLELSARCVRALAQRAPDDARAHDADAASPSAVLRARGGAWQGLAIVARNPFVLTIGIYIALQTLVAAFLNLELNQLIERGRAAGPDRVAVFAERDFWTQVATLGLQIFVTGRIIPWFGIGAALAIQPFVAAAGFTLVTFVLPSGSTNDVFSAELVTLDFALWTTVLFAAVFSATQNGISRPSRETLFTGVDRDTKYKAKSFLDTFVWRGGDALFSWTWKLLREAAALGSATVAACIVPCAFAWLGVGWFLGRQRARQLRASDVTSSPAPPAPSSDAPV